MATKMRVLILSKAMMQAELLNQMIFYKRVRIDIKNKFVFCIVLVDLEIGKE